MSHSRLAAYILKTGKMLEGDEECFKYENADQILDMLYYRLCFLRTFYCMSAGLGSYHLGLALGRIYELEGIIEIIERNQKVNYS